MFDSVVAVAGAVSVVARAAVVELVVEAGRRFVIVVVVVQADSDLALNMLGSAMVEWEATKAFAGAEHYYTFAATEVAAVVRVATAAKTAKVVLGYCPHSRNLHSLHRIRLMGVLVVGMRIVAEGIVGLKSDVEAEVMQAADKWY
jgi:hypothetical protein